MVNKETQVLAKQALRYLRMEAAKVMIMQVFFIIPSTKIYFYREM